MAATTRSITEWESDSLEPKVAFLDGAESYGVKVLVGSPEGGEVAVHVTADGQEPASSITTAARQDLAFVLRAARADEPFTFSRITDFLVNVETEKRV